jgi:uroporphyrinogen-III synthase
MVPGDDGSVLALPAPLAGWRVAVTGVRRREEQAALLRQAGADVVFAGGSDGGGAGAGDPVRPAAAAPGSIPEVCLVDALARRHVDAVTFTTTAAVEHLVGRATGERHGAEALAVLAGDVVPACLGAGCAEAASRAGMTGIVRAERIRLGALVEALASHFERASVRLRLDGCDVVLQGGLARVGADEVWLSGRERAVLGVLARRPGTVVAKDELLRSVWGAEDVDAHAVEVAVGRLRRRLGPAGAGLEAVPRRGYRLAAG